MGEYMRTLLNGLKVWVGGEISKLRAKIEAVATAASKTASLAAKNKADIAGLNQDMDGAYAGVSSAQNAASQALTAANNAKSTADTAKSTADAAQAVANAIAPNDNNYFAMLLSRSSAYAGWWDCWPIISINKASGYLYKNAWTYSDPLAYDLVPNPFVSDSLVYNGYSIIAKFSRVVVGNTNRWYLSGTGFGGNGKIFRIKTNELTFEQSTGLVFTITELYDKSLDITGTVGQIIKIAEVDANGKPTAWEAVDMGDSTILQSSTAGSTKKFRITVDDDGTLSATEVTS